jgi:hypothetical protein
MTRPHCSGKTAGRRGARLRRLKRAHTRDNVGVEDAFGYILVIVVVVSAIVAVLSLRGERYDHIGRGGLFEDDPKQRRDEPMSTAIRDEEVRQMLDARNARRAAKGQAPLDVEEELARLTKPVRDPALESEVRQLVEARNARRVRRGQAPLDVETEVRRQLDDLMG